MGVFTGQVHKLYCQVQSFFDEWRRGRIGSRTISDDEHIAVLIFSL